MKAKTSGWKFQEKQKSCLKASSLKHLLIIMVASAHVYTFFRALLSRRWSLLLLVSGAGLRGWPANNRIWKGNNSNYVGAPGDTTFTERSRFTSPVVGDVDITHPLVGCVEKSTSCSSPAAITSVQSWENKLKLKVIRQDPWLVLFTSDRVRKGKARLRNHHWSETKALWLSVMCSLATGKGHE